MTKKTLKRTAALALGIVSVFSAASAAFAAEYISVPKAKEIALDYAGVSAEGAEFTKAKLDKKQEVYDVEFTKNGHKYDFEIGALKGEVQDYDFKADDRDMYSISMEKAKTTALKHAGLKISQVKFEKAEKDCGNFVLVFKSGEARYGYVIDGETGIILKSSFDKDGAAVKPEEKPETKPEQKPAGKVSLEEAKKTALKDAGLKDAEFDKAEQDKEHGRMVWELEFRAGKYEYEYDIDMETGKITDRDRELIDDDEDDDKEEVKPEKPDASQKKALEAALKHAGVNKADAKEIEVSEDDGVYEVEFKSGKYEYEYEIDMKTGKIIDSEKEIDD